MGKSKELAELGDVVTQDSGNMLVGTTGHFNYSGGTTEITVGTDGTGSSAGGAVTFVSNNGATTLGYAGFQESEAAIGTMGSRALKLTTDNTARITVDASGRVTMPYQPAFHVIDLTFSSGTSSYGTGGTVKFNRGNCYSTSTGRFTAPVTGLYYFWGAIQHFLSGSTTYVGLLFDKNGAGDTIEYVSGIGGSYNNHQEETGAYLAYLNANDYVNIEANRGARNGVQNAFMGYLLG